MDRQFEVRVLLGAACQPDLAALAKTLSDQFSMIGPAVPTELSDGPGLAVDGAEISVTLREARCGFRTLAPFGGPGSAEGVSAGDPAACHTAFFSVICRGPEAGRSWMRAYATVASTAALVIGGQTDGTALVFPSSRVLLPPKRARIAVETAVRGVSPIEAWISFHPLRPHRPDGPAIDASAMHGAVTMGLAPFLGREMELAPMPLAEAEALQRLYAAAWLGLDGEVPLAEGAAVRLPGVDLEVRLALSSGWARPGTPAIVLLAPNSPFDPVTLRQKPPAPVRMARNLADTALGAIDPDARRRQVGAVRGQLAEAADALRPRARAAAHQAVGIARAGLAWLTPRLSRLRMQLAALPKRRSRPRSRGS